MILLSKLMGCSYLPGFVLLILSSCRAFPPYKCCSMLYVTSASVINVGIKKLHAHVKIGSNRVTKLGIGEYTGTLLFNL